MSARPGEAIFGPRPPELDEAFRSAQAAADDARREAAACGLTGAAAERFVYERAEPLAALARKLEDEWERSTPEGKAYLEASDAAASAYNAGLTLAAARNLAESARGEFAVGCAATFEEEAERRREEAIAARAGTAAPERGTPEGDPQ